MELSFGCYSIGVKPCVFFVFQSSIDNHQSTVINPCGRGIKHQSTIINHQSSIINHQSTINNQQSTVINPRTLYLSLFTFNLSL